VEIQGHEVDNKKRTGRTLIAVCVAILALGLAAFGYYRWRQSVIVLEPPLGYVVSCEETADLEQVGRAWFGSLVDQHQQPYLRAEDRIQEYQLDAVNILENAERKIVQLDFFIQTQVAESETFDSWGGVYEGTRLEAQWVVEYLTSPPSIGDDISYMATDIRTPAAYDIEQYNASGQKERDEYYEEFHGEKPYDKTKYTYKIENEICSVSFDGGASWVETPLPLAQLDYNVDGHFKYNELQAGSYIISPEKTVLLYGGHEAPLSLVYSEDQGKNWHTVRVNGALLYIRIKFCSFPTAREGFIVVGHDKTMSSEMQTVLKTADGGETWAVMGNGPRTSLMQAAGFIDADTGFLVYRYVEGAEAVVYRTGDSGKTWVPVPIEMDQELTPFFTRPQAPVWEEGKLLLLIDEGPDSDYKGAHTMQLQYTSEDKGKTWTFSQMVELEVDQPG